MAKGAQTYELDPSPDTAEATAGVLPRARLAFRPETFFLGRTDGAGVLRNPLGRIVRRCRVATHGERDPAQALLRFDEVFSYDDGEVDTWRWVMTAGHDGRYVAAEARAGAGINGELLGDDYLLAFRRPVGHLGGPLAPRFRTRFTLLSNDTALKHAAVSLFGLPLGVLTAIHRRVT